MTYISEMHLAALFFSLVAAMPIVGYAILFYRT